MSTNDFAEVEPCDTTDESDDKLYTRHREPEHVGGELYWRCEECGGESIFGRESILHYEHCSHGDRL